jgi:hypothetical protein
VRYQGIHVGTLAAVPRKLTVKFAAGAQEVSSDAVRAILACVRFRSNHPGADKKTLDITCSSGVGTAPATATVEIIVKE